MHARSPVPALASLVALVALVATPASAAVPAVSLDDLKRGSLLMPTDDPRALREVPATATEIHADVRGLLVRTRVTQRFAALDAAQREALYAFPLPTGAVVDELEVRIGDRVITGEIQERGRAQRTFETAKREGRKAALVEQHRPNLFTNRLANLPAGAAIEVRIGYSEVLRYADGRVSITFPTAVTPRYTPAEGAGAEGRVPDAAVLGGPVKVTLAADAGFPVRRVLGPGALSLRGERHIAVRYDSDRAREDVTFTWIAAPRAEPYAALLEETFEGESYTLLMVTPPSIVDGDAPRTPRQMTFVIDSSGSMEGESMEQARRALADGLSHLEPGDTFNVIDFDSDARALFERPAPFTPRNLARARAFLRGLEAEGGTEMLRALELAFRLDAPSQRALRQLVFITDGSVSNEAALFDAIRAQLDDRRLFTVGIGRAPNRYFMQRAAEFGRGTFTFVSDVGDVGAKMSALFARIGAPQLTGLAVDFEAAAEVYPPRIPDVYAGEPILVAARTQKAPARVVLRGQRGDGQWVRGVAATSTGVGDVLHKVWAHRKIDALTAASRAYADGGQRDVMLQTALRHRIVSPYTSLVAVEERPELARAPLPRTATPALLYLLLGGALAAAGALGLKKRRRA